MSKQKKCGCEKNVFACRQHVHGAYEHTPGPWIAEDDYAIVDEGGFEIAYVESSVNHKANGEAEANARLIASAPELLQAVKDALLLAELHDLEGAAIDNYRRVIAKAEGK